MLISTSSWRREQQLGRESPILSRQSPDPAARTADGRAGLVRLMLEAERVPMRF
jgi:hypothetical protein